MSGDPTNDNAFAPSVASEFEGHGQAAMLLVESLIHGLIEQSVITVAKAVEIVDVAAEVKRTLGVDRGENPVSLDRSVAALEAIGNSLRHDLPRE